MGMEIDSVQSYAGGGKQTNNTRQKKENYDEISNELCGANCLKDENHTAIKSAFKTAATTGVLSICGIAADLVFFKGKFTKKFFGVSL